MIVKVIEKDASHDGTVQGFKDQLRKMGTNAALHQIKDKLQAYLMDFACPVHPGIQKCTVEVKGEDLTSPGATLETGILNPCCDDFKDRFEAKVGEFFEQYKE